MLQVEMLDFSNKTQLNEFIRLPFRLYKNCPQWCPPFITDVKTMLDKKKHPFYEHSDADWFMVRRDGNVVARGGAIENRAFNKYHGTTQAAFYLFETENDPEAVQILFEQIYDWARKRGLNKLVGPKGFGPFDGYGMQVLGFEHHQMMTMMNYNFPYYNDLMTSMGFDKEVDFVSCYMYKDNFKLGPKIDKVYEIVMKRGKFKVKNFKNKRELVSWADRIGEAYNNTFVNNWEYFPFTQNEIKFVVDQLVQIAVPELYKIITYEDKVVGFLLGFPDISKALQRGGGNINPVSVADMLISLKTTKWISLNGVGILPEYQGSGGNVILYEEMKNLLIDYKYEHAELTQMAESATQVRRDIITVGAVPYKNHRVYHRDI
jgi:hypothetical protein